MAARGKEGSMGEVGKGDQEAQTSSYGMNESWDEEHRGYSE